MGLGVTEFLDDNEDFILNRKSHQPDPVIYKQIRMSTEAKKDIQKPKLIKLIRKERLDVLPEINEDDNNYDFMLGSSPMNTVALQFYACKTNIQFNTPNTSNKSHGVNYQLSYLLDLERADACRFVD